MAEDLSCHSRDELLKNPWVKAMDTHDLLLWSTEMMNTVVYYEIMCINEVPCILYSLAVEIDYY